MATVVVFHHALGRTPGVEAFANALAVAGHDVITPDLFDGRLFDSVEAGVAHAQSIGFEQIADQGSEVAANLGGPYVVVGFSLGVLPAQKLAQNDERITAAVLCHSALPLGFFADEWPADVALQIHAGDRDPFVDEDRDAIAQLVAAASTSECHWYDTGAHLVADVSSPDYDAGIARQIVTRTLEFIAESRA